MNIRAKLNQRGLNQLLHSKSLEDNELAMMRPVLAAAQTNAPVDTGAYRDSLRLEVVHTDDGVVARLISDSGHALIVEADTGNMVRALGAVG